MLWRGRMGGHWHAYATPNNQEVEICYKVERLDEPEDYVSRELGTIRQVETPAIVRCNC